MALSGAVSTLLVATTSVLAQGSAIEQAQDDIAESASTLTHDAVAARAIDALGGPDAIDRIESVYFKINISAPEPVGTRELYWSRDGGLVVVVTRQGVEIEQGIVGSIGWVRDPGGRASLLPESDLDQSRRETVAHLIALGFERFSEHGYKRLDESNEVNGQIDAKDTHQLVYGDEKTGFTTIHHDVDTGLPLAIEHFRMQDLVTFTTRLGEWLDVEDKKFFGSATVTVKPTVGEALPPTTLTFEAIEVNSVDPARFIVPADVQQLASERESRREFKTEGVIALEDLPMKYQKEAPMIIEMVKSEGPDSIKEFIEQFGTFSEEMSEGPQKDTFRYIIQELRKGDGGG